MRKIIFKTIACLFLFAFVSFFILVGYLLSRGAEPVILMYHSVGEAGLKKNTILNISIETFERQMEFLYRHHYRVVSLLDLAESLEKNKKMPSKTVVLTFDDGYENNYTHVLPILKKYHFSATVFVIVNYLGKEKVLCDHFFKFMTLAMLQEMSNSGLVTIGSHTKNHFYLPKIKDDQFLWEEIRGSKEVLEKILHKPVEAFCYPIGGSTPRTEDVVRKAGYRVAVAISSSKGKGANNIYALSRIKMTKETANPIVLFLKLSGYYSRLRALEER